MKTLSARVTVTVLALALFAGSAVTAQALTQSDVDAICLIVSCTTQQRAALSALVGNGSGTLSCYAFTRDLTVGARGSDVSALQSYLSGTGHYTFAGGATGYFGPITQAAVAAWQTANGVSPAAGYFGPLSRSAYSARCMSAPNQPADTDNEPQENGDSFSGNGEGYLDDFDQISKYSAEAVGEGEKDVSVLGIDFEALGTDQRIERVIVEVDSPTGEDDLEDFVDSVSLWLDGKLLKRMDVDDASHNRSADRYTFRFTNLTGIVKNGKKAELTVRVSGTRNLDSADEGDGWTITLPASSIRAASPNGVVDEYDSSAFSETFTVESFASATGVELRVTRHNDSPRAQVVNVDDTSDTDDVLLLVGTLEAKGSDVTITELPVLLTALGANVNQIANRLTLTIDGDEYSETVSAAATVATITFDDLDIEIEEGEKMKFSVFADINDLEGAFGEGDTLKAELRSFEVDAIEAEDESGEDLTAADLGGTALGEEQAFYDAGIYVTFVSATESVSVNDGSDNDTGTFKIKYRVEAFDSTVYVSDSAVATTAESIPDETVSGGVRYRVDKTGTATTADLSSLVTFTKKSGTVTDSGVTNGVQITDGSVAEFTLTVTRTNSGDSDDDGLFRVLLQAITWATSDSSTQNVYDFNLEDYKTDPISLN